MIVLRKGDAILLFTKVSMVHCRPSGGDEARPGIAPRHPETGREHDSPEFPSLPTGATGQLDD